MNHFFLVNKKYILILIFSIFSFQGIKAQGVQGDFWNHVRFGGGIGLNFGDGFFSGTLAPSGIYEFNNSLALGLGLNATFNNQKDIYKSTILGGSIIGFYNVIPQLQLSAEFEQLNVDRNYNVNLNIADENYWVSALFIGIGYRSGNVTFGVRYDVLYDRDQSIYIDPWMPFVRFYF
jgi:hypothetical protein